MQSHVSLVNKKLLIWIFGFILLISFTYGAVPCPDLSIGNTTTIRSDITNNINITFGLGCGNFYDKINITFENFIFDNLYYAVNGALDYCNNITKGSNFTFDCGMSGFPSWLNLIFTEKGIYHNNYIEIINTSINTTGIFSTDTNISYFNITVIYGYYFNENTTYNINATEGSLQPINTNVTFSSNVTNILATIIYDNISYSLNKYNQTNSVIFNTTILTPMNRSSSYFLWNFTIYLNDNTTISNLLSNIYKQNFNNISSAITFNNSYCNPNLQAAMCWNFGDEQNLSQLQADTIDYNFEYGTEAGSFYRTYGEINNTNTTCLCINSTLYNNYFIGYGELWYKKNGYADRRFYTFSNERATNNTINTTLYFLLNSEATSFLYTFKDTSLNTYIGNYTALLRWYPQLNSYKVVEMAKTDDKGSTIMRVEVEDPDYRVGLYHTSGSLIKLLNPVRFACLSSPCSYSVIIEETPLDYSSIFKVETSLSYDYTYGIWTFIWNDPTQLTQNMTLRIFLKSPTSYKEVCNSSGAGSTGVLSCNTSIYTGTLEGIGYRTASPLTPIINKVIETGTSPFRSRIGLFIGFLTGLTIGLIGIWSPIIALIGLLIGLIIPLFLKSITTGIFMALCVVVGIVIHFYKRTEG